MEMKTPRTFYARLRNLFRKNELDRELDAEMAVHLDLHTGENLRAGMSPERARHSFGHGRSARPPRHPSRSYDRTEIRVMASIPPIPAPRALVAPTSGRHLPPLPFLSCLAATHRTGRFSVPPSPYGTFPKPLSYLSCGLTTEGPVSFCGHHTGATDYV
jgi:hypothetical protein